MKAKRRQRRRFLCFADVLRVRTLLALGYLVGYLVALLELREGDAFERVSMEEKVLLNANLLDEAAIALIEFHNLAGVLHGSSKNRLPF